MNLFFLSTSPKGCVVVCDKHIVKMPLETAQMLYTAHHLQPSSEKWKNSAPENFYRKTHTNHPVAVWVRLCRANYSFAASVGMELCYEYTRRYKRVHACQSHLEWLYNNHPCFTSPVIPETYKHKYFATEGLCEGCTKFPLAMPDNFYHRDVRIAYRRYLSSDNKAKFSKWNYSKTPLWFIIMRSRMI